MSDQVQSRLLDAIAVLLRPLARLLLRSGITYRQFADVAKVAFLQEAYAETDSRGRKLNASRVAGRIGLSRKEIKKIIDAESEHEVRRIGVSDKAGPLAKVLYAWHTDSKFLDPIGEPSPLPFEGEGTSFSTLVRSEAGDLPIGAVRAELKRAGAIDEREDGQLVAVKRYYVPSDVDEKAVAVISGMLFPLASGIEHNANPLRSTDGFIQRLAFSDHLPDTMVPVFRHWARDEAARFIESMDDWLSRNESSQSDQSEQQESHRVGVGVFYYEGPTADQIMETREIPKPRGRRT